MRRMIVIAFAAGTLLAACGGKSAFDLQPGDCFDDPSSFEEVETVPEKDCADPHDNEVYANRAMPGTAWPGQAEVEQWADDACYDEFQTYVGVSYEESVLEFGWLVPTQRSWEEIDDRTVSCILYDGDLDKLTGSMQGARV